MNQVDLTGYTFRLCFSIDSDNTALLRRQTA